MSGRYIVHRSIWTRSRSAKPAYLSPRTTSLLQVSSTKQPQQLLLRLLSVLVRPYRLCSCSTCLGLLDFHFAPLQATLGLHWALINSQRCVSSPRPPMNLTFGTMKWLPPLSQAFRPIYSFPYGFRHVAMLTSIAVWSDPLLDFRVLGPPAYLFGLKQKKRSSSLDIYILPTCFWLG